MKISLDWLSQHVDISGLSTEELARVLTFAGVEVEEIEETRLHDNIVVAEVLEKSPHPDADKLTVCRVNHGENTSQIVCGAKNFDVGDKVPLALPGTVLPGGMKIKKGKLRGVESQGMMCSGNELGVSSDAAGLMILEADATAGTKLNAMFPADTLLTIEVTPNRPDWLSHLGLAREVAAVASRKMQSEPVVKSSLTIAEVDENEIQVDTHSACRFYSARLIKGVSVGASPDWLRQRLQSVGLRPVNNVVDVTNFVLMEMGQPLHAFDVQKLAGGIHVRQARKGEKLVALDGNTYELTAQDTVIADGAKALAIAGVMGGDESGVTESTSEILLESAYFEPSRVRATSHRLGLSSDSSYRFERGVDPQQIVGASELAAKLILELAGGESSEETRVTGALPQPTEDVTLDHEQCRQLLGAPISDDDIEGILSSLGLLKVTTAKAASTWKIPSYRLDLTRPVDLIEEVARVHGLENMPSTNAATASLPSPEDGVYDTTMRLKRHLVSLGFSETPTLSMISKSQIENALAGDGAALPIKNPLGTDYKMMRTTLLAGLATHELSSGLLNVASRNANLGAATVRIFEIGQVYAQDKEDTVLSLLVAGSADDLSWMTASPRPLSIHDLRGVIESLLPRTPIRMEVVKVPQLPIGADLFVKASGQELHLGRLGQVAPEQCRKIGYSNVLVAELRLATICELQAKPSKYQEVSPYPAVTRDVAMEVDAEVSNQAVGDFFRKCNEQLLESYVLFDVFTDPTGKKLSASKKSLAYSLTYRSKKGTLESAAVDKAHAKVLTSLQSTLNAKIR